ncbi:MAG: DNA-3-methyladenine glycosylase I [Bacteroides sp.]|nr:DNA-3-methyladenine glycosylase I [Bacteroides sp.]
MQTPNIDKPRCFWANPKNPLYIEYHDKEWGVPEHDDRKLFEMLILEGFQAGLSWECVLNKREVFRRVFAGFDPRKVAAFTETQQERLMAEPGIIRNRLKIKAATVNAQIFMKIQAEFGSFDAYLQGFTQGKTLYETGKVSNALSDALSRDLRKRGMKFVGTTIIYAFLQAVGAINSHEKDCFLYCGRN